jgi:hypothetical protein
MYLQQNRRFLAPPSSTSRSTPSVLDESSLTELTSTAEEFPFTTPPDSESENENELVSQAPESWPAALRAKVNKETTDLGTRFLLTDVLSEAFFSTFC